MKMVVHNMYVGEINRGLKAGSIIIDANATIVTEMFQKQFGSPLWFFKKYKRVMVPIIAEACTLSEKSDQVRMAMIMLFFNLSVMGTDMKSYSPGNYQKQRKYNI